MEQVSKERREVAKRVMRAMRYASAREPLAEAAEDGAQHLVVCLASDTVAYAAERVTAAGGVATVVVPATDRPGLIPLQWRNNILDGTLVVDVESKIHPESSVGMLAELISMQGERGLTFRITTGAGEADVTERELLQVPA